MAKNIMQLVIKEANNTKNHVQGLFVTKIGIQGQPGTCFTINGGNNFITIGKYGIYELDLSNLGGVITSLVFPVVGETNQFNPPIIVDIVYEEQEGSSAV